MKVGYCRVSTQKAEQDISISGQERQLFEAGCEEVISERKSAYKGKRPGWRKLWSLVASGKVSEVLVVDQSRLSRSGDDLEFLEACALNKVTVRALSGGVIEVASIGGFVQAGILSVVNRAQSKIIGAKVADGLARRRAAGHYAVGMVPFGFAYVDGVVVPHPENWEKARAKWAAIVAMEMNIHGFVRKNGGSVSGLKSWVRNPMLRGIVPHQKGGVKPLISPEEWEQAKRLLDRRAQSRVPVGVQRTHLFSSLIVCASCGRSLHRCVTDYHRVRWKCCYAPCDWFGRSIKEELARQQAVEALQREAPLRAQAALQSSNAMESKTTSEQDALRSKIAQLEELQDSGVADLGRSIDNLRSELAMLSVTVAGPDWSGLCELIEGGLDDATDEELRPLFLEYLESIVFEGNPKVLTFKLRGATGSDVEDGGL